MAGTDLTSAGAAVGTAIMPGIGTAIGALGGALLGGFMGGDGPAQAKGPTGPASTAVAVYGSGLSGDNWNVNFRGSQVNTSSAYKPFSATGPTASTAGEGGAVMPMRSAEGASFGGDFYGVPTWAWLAGLGLIAWKALKLGK